jgi:hypothetical protein
MLSLDEFKQRYSMELNGLSDNEILYYYKIYQEDPFEFNSDMIG